MFCEKCGKPIDMDKTVCDECAAKEQAENAAQAECENIVLDQAAEEPKKNKKGLLIGIVAAVAALAVLAVVLCMGPLKGLWVKSFGTPAEYMLYVEEKAAASGIQGFVQMYSDALKQNGGLEEASMDMQMHVLLGDKLLTLLEQSLASEGAEMELDFLSDIAIRINGSWTEDMLAAKADLDLNNKQVIGLEVYADEQEEKMLVGVPTLSSQYLQTVLEGITNPFQTYETYQLFPSAEDTKAVLETYTGIALKYLSKVERSTETVTVEGVKQELTVLTLTVTAKDLSNMVIEMLETAQTDKDLEAVLDALSAYVNATYEKEYESWKGVPGLEEMIPEKVDIHAEMMEEIPESIEEIRDGVNQLTYGDYLQLTDYVDGSHNICGRAVEVFEENVSFGAVRCLTVTDGKKSALELDMTQLEDVPLYIAGEYTENNGKINGSLDITVADVTYMTLELVDCTQEKETLKLIPTDAFLRDVLEMGGDVSSVLGLASPNLEIISSGNNRENAKMEVYLKAGDAMLAGITVDATVSPEASVVLPEGPYVEAEDADAVTEWASGLDVEKLMDNLVAAGVPEELIQSLLMALMYA